MNKKLWLLIAIIVVGVFAFVGQASAQPCVSKEAAAQAYCGKYDWPGDCNSATTLRTCDGDYLCSFGCFWQGDFAGGVCIFTREGPPKECPHGCEVDHCKAAPGEEEEEEEEEPGICGGPIVPCGSEDNPCKLCHFFVMFENIVDFVLFCLVPPIATLMLVIGGVMFIFSYGVIPGRGETPTQIAKAKKLITSVLIGLLIIYGAYLIINLFMDMIGLAQTDFGASIQNWFELDIPCD